jgi:hypothetical protein
VLFKQVGIVMSFVIGRLSGGVRKTAKGLRQGGGEGGERVSE